MGPLTLRVASAAGTAVACGVSGLIVASDPKPATAPLRPTVAGPAAPAPAAALVIPPSCGAPVGTSSNPPVKLNVDLAPSYAQLRQAMTAAARAAVLAALPPDQRQQLVAYARQQQRRTAGAGATSRCAPGSGAPAGGDISASISDAPPSTTPLINSYVS